MSAAQSKYAFDIGAARLLDRNKFTFRIGAAGVL